MRFRFSDTLSKLALAPDSVHFGRTIDIPAPTMPTLTLKVHAWPAGWRNVPYRHAANTIYVASYLAPVGHYAADSNYFATSGTDSPPLHALQNGVSGGDGVYTYASGTAFPSSPWNFIPGFCFLLSAPATRLPAWLRLSRQALPWRRRPRATPPEAQSSINSAVMPLASEPPVVLRGEAPPKAKRI